MDVSQLRSDFCKMEEAFPVHFVCCTRVKLPENYIGRQVEYWRKYVIQGSETAIIL